MGKDVGVDDRLQEGESLAGESNNCKLEESDMSVNSTDLALEVDDADHRRVVCCLIRTSSSSTAQRRQSASVVQRAGPKVFCWRVVVGREVGFVTTTAAHGKVV